MKKTDINNALQKHVPCCVGAYWVSKVNKSAQYSEFKGPQCIAEFVDYLDDMTRQLFERNKTETRVPAMKTIQEFDAHKRATLHVV